MDFASNLRNVRNEKGVKQTVLAQQIKMSQPAISQMESGKIKPSSDTINLLAQKLGVPLETLVCENITIEQTFNDQSNNQAKNGVFVDNDKIVSYLEEIIKSLKETLATKDQLIASKDLLINSLKLKNS